MTGHAAASSGAVGGGVQLNSVDWRRGQVAASTTRSGRAALRPQVVMGIARPIRPRVVGESMTAIGTLGSMTILTGL